MAIRRMRLAMLNNKGYKHKLRICNSFCFSTATIVRRKQFNVMLYVHKLSCSSFYCINTNYEAHHVCYN